MTRTRVRIRTHLALLPPVSRDYGSSGDVAIINGPLPSARYAAELASYDSASSAAGPNGRTRYGMSSGGGPSSFNVFSHDGQVRPNFPMWALSLRSLQSVGAIVGQESGPRAAAVWMEKGRSVRPSGPPSRARVLTCGRVCFVA